MSSLNMLHLTPLVMFPYGTKGYEDELRAIRSLNELCKEFGYGRIPQLATQLEDLWRNPDKLQHYRNLREQHLERMEADRRWLEEHKDDPE